MFIGVVSPSSLTSLEHCSIFLISCNSKVTTVLISVNLWDYSLFSLQHSLWLELKLYYLLTFFFFCPCSKCKLFPATPQDFSPLMIWREITTHSADRGKSTRISNTSDKEWYTVSGSKLNTDSYPKTLVSLSALLPLSLWPQIWEKVSRSAATILKICRSKKSPVN